MKRHATLVVVSLVLGSVAACTIIDAPTQCRSDDDCIRFDARCDVGQGVCVEAEGTAKASTYASGLDAGSSPDARKDSAPATDASLPDPTTTTPAVKDAATDSTVVGLLDTIACGDKTCPVGPDSVCCINDTGPTCTTAKDCAGSPITCDDTQDCAALGSKGTICCAFNDGNGPALLRATCVPPDQCDANGPQDQLCSLTGPADQCDVATPGHTVCRSFTYTNATYAFCATP